MMAMRALLIFALASFVLAGCDDGSSDLPMNEHRIAVPSDDLHGHYLLRSRTLPNGNKQALHLQLSNRGFATYSLTEYDCSAQSLRSLGSGESEEEALSGANANQNFLLAESPTSLEVLENVCGR